ncbi:Cytochrome c oxidase assembly protein CtaG [Candidatus Hodgkinia cicadicola]|nr:Cytochrome c oxidase assembly protein CtaG [Candidatus Hodgkinia cicadicola]
MRLKEVNTKLSTLLCAFIVGAMTVISFFCAIMYKQFCSKTGYAGTTKRVKSYNNNLNDTRIKIRFVANTDDNLLWLFKPSVAEVYAHPGEIIKTSYVAKNLANDSTVGEATYNVTPHVMGKYFNKVQCFCFTKINIDASKEEILPLVFYIDPKVNADETAKSVKTITLMYNMGLPL